MNKKRVIAAGGAAAFSLIMALPAFAATPEQNATTSPAYLTTQHHSQKKSGGSSEGSTYKIAHADFGTITSIDGSSFTLQRKSGTGTSTVTIHTNSATVFKENGKAGASFANLAVGQRIVVMGAKDSAGTIADATSVTIMVRTAKNTAVL